MNSFHHQAVDRLGRGLRAVAWAPDGTVEGIEDRGERLVLGVQWHAETLDRPGPHPRLFEALVAAASGERLDLAAASRSCRSRSIARTISDERRRGVRIPSTHSATPTQPEDQPPACAMPRPRRCRPPEPSISV